LALVLQSVGLQMSATRAVVATLHKMGAEVVIVLARAQDGAPLGCSSLSLLERAKIGVLCLTNEEDFVQVEALTDATAFWHPSQLKSASSKQVRASLYTIGGRTAPHRRLKDLRRRRLSRATQRVVTSMLSVPSKCHAQALGSADKLSLISSPRAQLMRLERAPPHRSVTLVLDVRPGPIEPIRPRESELCAAGIARAAPQGSCGET
jgi:hypothetical protein